MSDDNLIDRLEIANPQHPKVALVLLLDTSGSMSGSKIEQLNEALVVLKQDLFSDDLARKRVEIAVVTFGERINVNNYFTSVEDFNPIQLIANGYTPMGDAIDTALDLIEQRKQEYKSKGMDYYRPWIFLITDGEPTDMKPGDFKWNSIIEKIKNGETNKKFAFFVIGVEPANMDIIKQIAPLDRPALNLKDNRFKDMFVWISISLQAVSKSRPGEQVYFENPVTPSGWGSL